MDLETIRAEMLAQVDEVRHSAHCEAFGWQLEVQDLVVYVSLRPRRRPDLAYLLRVMFEDFPRRAPSYVFVDPITKQLNPSAWPPNTRHDAAPTGGICTPGTQEFHEYIHKNDAQYAWDPARFPFLVTLAEIHRIMERAI